MVGGERVSEEKPINIATYRLNCLRNLRGLYAAKRQMSINDNFRILAAYIQHHTPDKGNIVLDGTPADTPVRQQLSSTDVEKVNRAPIDTLIKTGFEINRTVGNHEDLSFGE